MYQETAFIGVVCVSLAWVLYLCARYATSKLPPAPGPFLARFTRLWYLKAVVKGDFERVNIDLHRKYGKIVRLEPNAFSIDDPEAIKVIYNTSHPWIKSRWYEAASPPGTSTNFTTPDNKDSARYRRNLAPAFTMSSIVSFEPLIDECGQLLVEKLNDFADAGEVVDLNHWLTCWAFDCQGHMTFSQRFGFLDNGDDIGGIIESLRQRVPYGAIVGIYPEWHPTIFKIVNWLAGTGTGHIDYTIDYTLKRIAERKNQEKSGQTDMLAQFIASHEKDPNTFTDWDIMVGAFGNIVAGADTTWITLSAVLLFLLKNPACLQKVRLEVDQFAKAGEISDPISFTESQRMPYTQAVVKEAQRLYPGTGLPLWRVVPEGGAMIADKYFPGGAVVGVNTWVAHYNKDVFGADADVFRPERWLVGDTTAMNRYYFPFGVGPRTCSGLNVAILELSKMVPQLVRKFDFELVKEPKVTNHWFVFQSGFKVMVRARQ